MITSNRLSLFSVLFFLLLYTPSSHALELEYSGEFMVCTATCNSFDALGGQSGGSANTTNSLVTGFIDLPVGADNMFQFSEDDNVAFDFSFANAAVEAIQAVIGPDDSCPPPNSPGQICNVASANPLPLNSAVGRVSGSGEIGDDGLPMGGTLIFSWQSPPLSGNGIELRIDLGSGTGVATLFGGVITFFEFSGAFAIVDSDNDGVADSIDNCLTRPNSDQRDTDSDGYGNRCDADLDNNCIVNVIDLGALRSVFFTSDADADFNGDEAVNFADLGILRASFFRPPGPSALSEECASP